MAQLRQTPRRIDAPRLLLLGLVLGVGACATTAADRPSPRFTPDTRHDPPSAVAIAPQRTARTGEPTAVLIDAPETAARRVALSFVEAVREGDETGIRALSSGVFYRVVSNRLTSRPEPIDNFIKRILGAAHARRLASAEPLASYIDLHRLEVEPLPEGLAQQPGLSAGDRLVHLHSAREGKNALLNLLGFREGGRLVVRTTPEPLVVAF